MLQMREIQPIQQFLMVGVGAGSFRKTGLINISLCVLCDLCVSALKIFFLRLLRLFAVKKNLDPEWIAR